MWDWGCGETQRSRKTHARFMCLKPGTQCGQCGAVTRRRIKVMGDPEDGDEEQVEFQNILESEPAALDPSGWMWKNLRKEVSCLQLEHLEDSLELPGCPRGRASAPFPTSSPPRLASPVPTCLWRPSSNCCQSEGRTPSTQTLPARLLVFSAFTLLLRCRVSQVQPFFELSTWVLPF